MDTSLLKVVISKLAHAKATKRGVFAFDEKSDECCRRMEKEGLINFRTQETRGTWKRATFHYDVTDRGWRFLASQHGGRPGEKRSVEELEFGLMRSAASAQISLRCRLSRDWQEPPLGSNAVVRSLRLLRFAGGFSRSGLSPNFSDDTNLAPTVSETKKNRTEQEQIFQGPWFRYLSPSQIWRFPG